MEIVFLFVIVYNYYIQLYKIDRAYNYTKNILILIVNISSKENK